MTNPRTLKREHPTASKNYACEGCAGTIYVGDRYECVRVWRGGNRVTERRHLVCPASDPAMWSEAVEMTLRDAATRSNNAFATIKRTKADSAATYLIAGLLLLIGLAGAVAFAWGVRP